MCLVGVSIFPAPCFLFSPSTERTCKFVGTAHCISCYVGTTGCIALPSEQKVPSPAHSILVKAPPLVIVTKWVTVKRIKNPVYPTGRHDFIGLLADRLNMIL